MNWSFYRALPSKKYQLVLLLCVCNTIALVVVTRRFATSGKVLTCLDCAEYELNNFDVTEIQEHVPKDLLLPWIYIITPTHHRLEQKADLTRLALTLRLVPNSHWIVVEDAEERSNVREWLMGARVRHTYLFHQKVTEKTNRTRLRGWRPRALAVDWLRNAQKAHATKGVIYFADDDNTYDDRLFNNYIRKVKRVGVWAVGLVGGALVEAPKVENGTVVGFHVIWAPHRQFPIDMAGFAVNLDLIRSSNVNFNENCEEKFTLETCFLEQLNITLSDMEPFQFVDGKKQVLVWHTKTNSSGSRGENYGYDV